MRIIVDLQGCQTRTSKDRGIGRYSMALTRAMARNARGHEVWLALNGALEDTIDPIVAAFDGLIPRNRIRVFDGSGLIAGIRGPKLVRQLVQARTREAFLAGLKPDFIHVSSLFEGGDAVTSIAPPSSETAQAITMYDLIPLLNPATHLNSMRARRRYMSKLNLARRADLMLAISEASRREAIDALELTDERVVNVSSAVDSMFRPVNMTPTRDAEIRARYGLKPRFLMYTGGNDERKNIGGLISAYAALPPDLRESHQLVVVCALREAERDRLNEIVSRNGLKPDDVIFTGFVPEDDLVALYNLCALFVFPSLHEGFGLPILEAMACGAPAIGANNSSIPEVVGLADALFDAAHTPSMAEKIATTLRNEDFRLMLRVHGLAQAKQFSWDRSAVTALNAMEAVHERRRRRES